MTVIYIDRVFALNLVLDYMLLLICARLAGTPLRRLRFLLCAAGGAFYAAAVFLPGCAALNGPVFRLLAGLAMSLAAFWCEVRRWRLTALFFLVSGALAGLLLAVGLALGSPGKLLGRVYYARVSWPVLLGTALGMSLLLRLVFGQAARHGGNEIMSITISLGGKCCTVRALHDTGCTLARPRHGGPVLVLRAPRARPAVDPAGAGHSGAAAPTGGENGPSARRGQWAALHASAVHGRRDGIGPAARGLQRLHRARRAAAPPRAARAFGRPAQRRRRVSGPVGRRGGEKP